MGRRFAGRAPWALLLTSAAAAVLAVCFDLSAIASIGSAVALTVFAAVSAGHLRLRSETGASATVLVLAVTTTVIVLAVFAATTLVHEPATSAALIAIVAVSVIGDLSWKRYRDRPPKGVDRSSPTTDR